MLAFPIRLRTAGCFLRNSFAIIWLGTVSISLPAAETQKNGPVSSVVPTLAPWVEPEFPFFSSVLDARKSGADIAPDNLTPRGLILNLGEDCWACFDLDLLRISALWRGPGVTPTALAPGSYHEINRKTQGGQKNLPQPHGDLWLVNGIYPGWQTQPTLNVLDPREPAPSIEEVGRGPISPSLGRFEALRFFHDGVLLEYTVDGTKIQERLTATPREGEITIVRTFHIEKGDTPLLLAIGRGPATTQIRSQENAPTLTRNTDQTLTLQLSPRRTTSLDFAVAHSASKVTSFLPEDSLSSNLGTAQPRWPQIVTTEVELSKKAGPYVVDSIELPIANPWRRGIRPADIQFLTNGDAFVVTLDGDVWRARGLDASQASSRSAHVQWKRFASGLHEPMTCALRDDQLYVFDKNGIWHLRDTNGDDEADVYELFSNAFAQTADNREFPSQIRLAPGGEFIIAKGGQQDTTLGKHNGSVLRVSADGRTSSVLGYGFRQPNIGVNIRTGLITSSDQQGQYIPSTPLHIVQDHRFYGFLAAFLPKEKYPEPPAEPLTWIPHAVNASAMSQVWLFGARMGPLTDKMVHIGFNKPEVFQVIWNHRSSRPQASVVSITQDFGYPPLNGSVNPVDGQLYIAGFQVIGWGNVLDVGAGLGRVRYTGAPFTLPREIVPTDRGILLRFETALDPALATNPASYSLQTWSYRRTSKYGSAQYKEDGTPGQDSLTPSAAYLSQDGRGVFVAVPGMKPVMQLRVGWALATHAGLAFESNAYTTPYELVPFRPQDEGFGDLIFDLNPRSVAVTETQGPVSIEEGQRVSQLFACIACHSTEGVGVIKAGPSWRGLYGSTHPVFIGGKSVTTTVDDAYLRESILDPTAKIAAGFEKGEYAMPSYAGVLTPSQVESLILYIKSLK
ncbi:MAG TPA: c-type cytochrome [Opitutaceae bacterium]|nr:c-type cytochrome [Opitutaceae bacterium]